LGKPARGFSFFFIGDRALAKKILLIQLRQLGDILLTTPCLREIKRQEPKTHITFLSHKMGRQILDGCPYLDEYFTYDNDTKFWDEVSLAHTLRQKNFDLVIDFMYNPRSALYARATGAPERLAYSSARNWAFTQTLPRPEISDYVVREKFRLLELAGYKPTDIGTLLPWNEVNTHPLVKLIGQHEAFKQAPVRVVLSPTHRREERRWPLASYARLADFLVWEFKACVMWLWGPGEEEEIDSAMKLCTEKTYKAPRTSFREMAAFIANNDLFIGNSNGPSHVAIAVDTCSFQLHGPTQARAWCPFTERHQALQGASMAALSVEDVILGLQKMQQTILAAAEKRRSGPPRLNWDRRV
jgi:ADP-heptose:LPS heptosyltransferase